MKGQKVTATILSVLFMGLGQLFNKQFMKGIILLVIEAASLMYFIPNLVKDLSGIITLGEQGTHFEKVNGMTVTVAGDHSIYLMIDGLITLFLLLIVIVIYAINIRDAYRTAAIIESGQQIISFKQTIKNMNGKSFPYILLSVPMLGVLFLTILPIIFMVMIAFTNYSMPNHIPPKSLVDWVGFQTFLDLLSLSSWSKTFFGVLTWTVIWAVLATVTCYFGGLLVALLIEQKGIRFKKLWRTIFILPYAIPQLISLLIMRNLFNGQFGPLNEYLAMFGLGKLPWLTDPTLAKATAIFVNMWIGIPVSMVLILGVLTAIPRDMYEAAEVDGANAYQKFKIVTLPFVLFATAPILITQFAGNINNFNLIFLLTGGDPKNGSYQFAGSTDLLVTWLYKLTLNQSQYNMASAIGIIIFIIIATLSIVNYRRTKSFKEEDMIQ
ncbi:carbohydrate ABC transporter permease [Paenibacillus endoradicis]|uniref:carbohydrate ABC transporter permease n=1 Tax=Paenibacillus endoradicis TaxID=2972487 RepID=UPI0021591FF6|nr:sugar ABC transporter permease [Paenibacillus endoradicis]MCR8660047.1 sugar ABC transporter permease [Paenibacillus endoradicis]